MYIGKVIGNIWATKKYETLSGMKMMLMQPLNADYKNDGSPIIAIDTCGSGPGEYVIYVTATEAVIPLPVDMAPVDASIVGIIDSVFVKKSD